MTLLGYKLSGPDTDSVRDLTAHVGNTPLIPLQRLRRGLSPRVRILAKAEWFNPGGSVKDRPALNIIRTALANGKLVPGKRLLDSTSGNMGISYATFGAVLGIPVTLTIPANASPERFVILSALGAELILTDPTEGSDGAILVARQLAAEKPDLYWYANQYDNPANWEAHYKSTGPGDHLQTNAEVTHFCCRSWNSGTLIGTGRYLRERLPDVQYHRLPARTPHFTVWRASSICHLPSNPGFTIHRLQMKRLKSGRKRRAT
jgi:cysteine synthase B